MSPKDRRRVDDFILYAVAAADEAVRDAGWMPEDEESRERTGVMIYVSLGERMAELIADEGIAEHVDAHVWDRAMSALTEGLKRADPAAGFTAAIGLCGEVLADHFPPRDGDNPNELPDAVVVLPGL